MNKSKREKLNKKTIALSLTIAALLAVSNATFAVERRVIKSNEKVKIENQNFEFLNFNGNGGAINNSGTIEVKNSSFNDNSAQQGGTIYNKTNELNIFNSTFKNNKAYSTSSPEIKLIQGSNWIYNAETNIATKINEDGTITKKTPAINYAQGTISITTYLHDTDGNTISNTEVIATFTPVNAQGGAIFNNSGNVKIENSVFDNNSASYKKIEDSAFDSYIDTAGGAIYQKNGNVSIKNSVFTNNTAITSRQSRYTTPEYTSKDIYDEGSGGAIRIQQGNLKVSDSNFENNSSVYGGAISQRDGALTIKNSNFNNNTAISKSKSVTTYNDISQPQEKREFYEGAGGAISTGSKLEITNSSFTNNTAGLAGSAIAGSTNITIKNSNFSGNKTLWESPYPESGTQTFSDVAEPDTPVISPGQLETPAVASGGVISTELYMSADGNLSIENSTFTNNKSVSGAGAISNMLNNAQIKNSQFNNNISETGNGGAISSLTLGIFSESKDKVQIENSSFTENKAGNSGGAISNVSSNMYVADTNFTNNRAKIGGAIASGNDITILAVNQDVIFSGNNAEKGNDIYLGYYSPYSALGGGDGIVDLNLNANFNKSIIFHGGIVGKDAVININNPSNSIYENLSSVGKIIVDNFIKPEQDSKLDLNIFNGSLKLTDEKYLNNVNLTIEENGTLDLRNGKTGLVSLGEFTSNNGSLYADVDFNLKSMPFDWIESDSGNGTLNIKDINIISDLGNTQNSYEVNLNDMDIWENLDIKTPENGINSVTEDYVYTTKIEDNKLTINRITDKSNNAVKVDGFTIAVNQTDNVAGKNIKLSDDRIFTASKDINITGKNSQKGWTGNLGGTNLTVKGNNHNLDGKNNVGFSINDGQTLTFNDTNITGFKDDIFTVKESGNLNLNNVKVTGANSVVTGTNREAVINLNNVDIQNNKSGITTAGSVNISGNSRFENNGNGIEVTSDDSVITLNGLDGDGEITINDRLSGVRGSKLNLKAGVVNLGKTVSGLDVNMNNSTTNLASDNLLNGLNMTVNSASNVNMMNNSVGTMHLNSLTLHDNMNLGVDVDLANKSMDRVTADSYNLGDNKVNVNQMTLLSDAKEVKTNIQFADEGLKNNVTTSVSEVAYSPIYKYDVNYDKNNGEFEFTRSFAGGGSGGGSPSYHDLNPSVMVAPVAAQLGGYTGMIDTYNNAFNNMDMRMLQPSSFRQAQNIANRYAIADGNGTYLQTENNSAGMWARPYTAYDSVRLKRGPKVHTMSYGTFIGGDSGIHDFGNGLQGVFSAHASYQGSHQSFAGNSIYQNGANLGFTGTLYKGNFFTGLTAATGVSLADASTMFGDEDFPMLTAGVASKTGYNIEFKDGKFIIQPSLLLSYTFVNAFNYTNAAGIKIDSQPLHAVQIAPNIRFSLNTKKHWQPYLTFGVNWNIMNNQSHFLANETALPNLSIKPYFQYGLGVQKLFNDNFTGFAQVALRSGGRNGIAATAGMRYLFDYNTTPSPTHIIKNSNQL